MLHIALYEPEIAPNTGNIMRLCANSGTRLHLIEPLGFDLDSKKVRRAGLDYRDLAVVERHANFAAFMEKIGNRQIWACTTKTDQLCHQVSYQSDDVLLFGPETRGLPQGVRDQLGPSQHIRIPMCADSRSMNLSNAVAVIAYEASRQLGFPGLG